MPRLKDIVIALEVWWMILGSAESRLGNQSYMIQPSFVKGCNEFSVSLADGDTECDIYIFDLKLKTGGMMPFQAHWAFHF